MSDKKNIDRLFQEKFKDFETAPSDAVWNRISNSLTNTSKKRKTKALWWQIGGIAATLALLLTAGVSVFNTKAHNTLETIPVVQSDKFKSETNPNSTLNTGQDTIKNRENTKSSTLEAVVTENSIISKTNTENTLQKTHASKRFQKTYKPKSNPYVAGNSEDSSADQKPKFLKTASTVSDKVVVANTSQKPNSTSFKYKTELKAVIENTSNGKKTNIAANTIGRETETQNTNIKATNTAIQQKDESEALTNLSSTKTTIEKAIAKAKTSEEKEDKKRNRWSVSPKIAPVYYSSLGKGSSIDKQFNNNSKRSGINMSYGISGSYIVSKKLKVRAGINRVELSQTTSDVITFSSQNAIALNSETQASNISFINSPEPVSIMSSNAFDINSKAFTTALTGDINQRYGFIEVPLELEYRVLDKRFGLNIISGFSTLFLSENEIFADLNGVSTLVGESNNINTTSFSANFGIGLDYSISKQWSINIEPTFKYQLNTFNNTSGNFNPYFIGIYSGLNFKF